MNRYSVAVESEDFLKSASSGKSEKLSNTKEMLSLSYSDINNVELKHSTSVVSRDESISSKTSFHNMFPNIMRLSDQVSNVLTPKPKNTMDLCDHLLSTLKLMLNKYSACSYGEEGNQSEDFNVTCSKLEDRIRTIENIFDNYMEKNEIRNDQLKNLQKYITSIRNSAESSNSNNRLSTDECNPLETYNSVNREMCQIESKVEEYSGKLQFQIMNIDACSRIKPQDQYELTVRSGDTMFFKTRIKIEKNGYQIFDCRNFSVTPTAENEIHIRFCELKTLNKSTLILEKKLTNINDLISIEPNIYSVWLTQFGLIKLNVIVQWNGMLTSSNTNRQSTLMSTINSSSVRSRYDRKSDDHKSTSYRHSMNVDSISNRLFETLSWKDRASSFGEIKEEDNRQNSPIPLKHESQTASIPSVIIQCDPEWDKGKGDSTLMTRAETLEITMEHDDKIIGETNNTKNFHGSISPINSTYEVLSNRSSKNEFDSRSENIDSPIIELSLDTNNNNENNLSIHTISNSSSIERINDVSIHTDDLKDNHEDEIKNRHEHESKDEEGDKTKYINQDKINEVELVNEENNSLNVDKQRENPNVEVEKEVEINEIKCDFNIDMNNDSIECIDEARENKNDECETRNINESVDDQNLENEQSRKSEHNEEANKEDDLKLGVCVVTEEIENFEEVMNECISENIEHGNEINELGVSVECKKNTTELDDFKMTHSNEDHIDLEQNIDNCVHDTNSEIKGEMDESQCQSINKVDTAEDSEFNNLISPKSDVDLRENVEVHQPNDDEEIRTTHLQGDNNLIVHGDVNKVDNTDDLTEINTISESINADLNIPSN